MSNANLAKDSRVMLLASTRWDVGTTNPLGVVGTILGKGLGLIGVRWDNQKCNDYMVDDSDFMMVVEVKSNEDLRKDDQVMMLANTDYEYPLGIVGTVVGIDNRLLRVYWDNGWGKDYFTAETNFVKVA